MTRLYRCRGGPGGLGAGLCRGHPMWRAFSMYVPSTLRGTLAAVLPWLVCWLPAEAPSCGQPSQETAEELIHRLGSGNFKVRQEATKHLVERKDAAAALQKALKSPALELEVAERLRWI